MYKILSRVGPLGTNLIFLSPLGLLRFQGFLSFLFILKLFYSEPFWSNSNYASTANIQEVMEFYNLGDKTFKTLNFYWSRCSRNSKSPMKSIQILTQQATLETCIKSLIFVIVCVSMNEN